MQSFGAEFPESEVSSFSSLLEKLSGCGIADSPVKSQPRQAAQAIPNGADELLYSAWPSATQPWQEPNAKVDQESIRLDRARPRRVKKRTSCKQTAPTAAYGRGEWDVDEEPGPVADAEWNEADIGQAFRRSVVSIRLNEDEMRLLRRRATESGISVSEYVRSCVVEAEQLRVQVKEVVAKMQSQPSVGFAQRGIERQDKFPDSSSEQESTRSFWSRWGAILLGQRERNSINLSASGARFPSC